MVWDVVSLEDGDTRFHNCVVFPTRVGRSMSGEISGQCWSYSHIAHRNHVVDLLDSQPMQDVGHECLEPHILDTSDELGRLEVSISAVTATFLRQQAGYVRPRKRIESISRTRRL